MLKLPPMSLPTGKYSSPEVLWIMVSASVACKFFYIINNQKMKEQIDLISGTTEKDLQISNRVKELVGNVVTELKNLIPRRCRQLLPLQMITKKMLKFTT